MPAQSQRLTLSDLSRDPGLYRILVGHALLGIKAQFVVRAALIVFLVLTAIIVTPARFRPGFDGVIAGYAVWSVAAFLICRQGDVRVIRLIWLTLLVDIVALGVLSLLAGADQHTWTLDVVAYGFFAVPMLATAQLRPGVAVGVTVPALAMYLGALIAGKGSNGEPWGPIFLGAAVLLVLSIGCVSLCWVQRSRVLTIAGLIRDRGELTAELVDVERTARRDLAEELHDGALQYILAARQELEDVRSHNNPDSLDRIEHALRESTTLLRAKVGQLHPAVLEQAGLRRALEDLTNSANRPDQRVTLDAAAWDHVHTPADELLYSAARELLANVAKHAKASHVAVTLTATDDWLTLTVADDGVGIAPGTLERRLSEGHVGMSSQRTRIEVSGGRFQVRPGDPGTVVEVALPAAD